MGKLNPVYWWRLLLALPNDSLTKTLAVALLVALASAIVVSTTSVHLRPMQEENRERERQARIVALVSAAIGDAGPLIARVVELGTGRYSPDIDPVTFDQRAAAGDPARSIAIPPEADIAGLVRRANHARVFLREVNGKIDLIVQITIIASLVIVADEILKAYAFETSKRLSVFVGLIISNCIVLARAESFAMRNPPVPSLLDGLGNGLGYSLILIVLGSVRELLGAGTLLEVAVLPTIKQGGWFEPLALMLKPASAFFMLGILVWIIRTVRRHQVEEPEFRPRTTGSKAS